MKQLNYLEDKHIRILKGCSEEELKKLENTKKDTYFNDLIKKR